MPEPTPAPLRALRDAIAAEHAAATRNAAASHLVPEAGMVHDGMAAGLQIALRLADRAIGVRDPELQRLQSVVDRIAELAAEYPAGIDTALVHEALDQPPINPPGSTREQLPADLLALIDLPDYLSTACQTAAACEQAYEANRRWIGLLQRAELLHARCRLNHKFTGQQCVCTCHEKQQDQP